MFGWIFNKAKKGLKKFFDVDLDVIINEIEVQYKIFCDRILIFAVKEMKKILKIVRNDFNEQILNDKELYLAKKLIDFVKKKPSLKMNDAVKTINENFQGGSLKELSMDFDHGKQEISVEVFNTRVVYSMRGGGLSIESVK